MNTIKMSKVLALIVVVAMVMAVVPAAFAANAGETITVDGKEYVLKTGNLVTDGTFENDTDINSIKTWNGSKLDEVDGTKVVLTEGGREGGKALTTTAQSAGGTTPNANLVYRYMLNDGDPIAETKAYAITVWVKGTAMTITMGASADPNNVSVDNSLNLTSKYGNNKAEGSDISGLNASDWTQLSTVVLAKAGETRCLEIYPRWCQGVLFDDIEIYELQPDAGVNVRIMAGDTVLEETNKDKTMEYFGGMEFSTTCDKYYVNGSNVYTLAAPKAVTLEKGEVVNYDIAATLYKTVEGTVTGANDSFENGIEGWAQIPDTEYEIVKDRKTDGESALWLKGVDGAAGTTFGGTWDVKANTRYLVSFDFMPTKNKGTQYMWLYTTDADGTGEANDPNADQYADQKDGSSGKLQQMNGGTVGKWETKQFVVWTGSKQTKLGFKTAWVANDTAPIIDNFKIVELKNIEGDVDYVINVQNEGKTVYTLEKQAGKVGDSVSVTEGQILNKTRVADKYYTNKASEATTLAAGTKEINVDSELIATITGFEPVSVAGVDNHDAKVFLPATVKTVVEPAEAVASEALPVTWNDKTGTVADTGKTVEATVSQEEANYSMADTFSYAVQDRQNRASAYANKLPADVNSGDIFAISFTVKVNDNGGDNWIFLNDSEAAYFGGSQICLGVNENFVAVDGDGNGNRVGGASTDAPIMKLEAGKSYNVLVQIKAADNKYNVAITNDANETAVVLDRGFRKNGTVNSMVAMSNSGRNVWVANDGHIEVTNIRVYHSAFEGTNPSANTVTDKGITYLDSDGDKVLASLVEVGGDTTGKKLVITALDTPSGNTADNVVYEGEGEIDKAQIAIVPKSVNLKYFARVIDTATGIVTGSGVIDCLADDIIADIAANVVAYGEDMVRVDQAVAALNQIGAVYTLTDDGATFNDGRDKFITSKVDKTPAEKEGDPDKITVTLTVNGGLFAKGVGFTVGVKSGTNGTAATLPEGVEGTVFQTITVNADGKTITLSNPASTQEAVTLSLDSVEIEFVATDVAESEAADAAADLGMVDEL